VPKSRKVETPASQVAGFIARFDPAIAKLTRAARAKVRKRLPTAVELVYDNYNALAIGFGPTERTSEAILSVAAYATGVTLYFTRGASLPDPHGRFEGAGNQGRFVRLTSIAVFDEPVVAELIDAAVAHSRVPFPSSGRGYTVVKSISARQRPRRPSRSTVS
jgi:hypothetical protein